MIGIDTNVILNVLRKEDPTLHKKGSLDFFRAVQRKKTELAISVITLTELFRKPFRDNSAEEKQKIDSFLHLINTKTIMISHDSAIDAARLIEELGMNFADALIAASLDFANIKTFVTRNTDDYKKTNLEILTPEDFMKKYY
ncbi:PIN domain-containing protein [Candidatus Woesearchaeota archaeon]|nr:PIN domain-containing protein [Candidatus Woesearchaeota archaeon]